MKREAEKIIDYKGKDVRIRKFSPLDGGYIAQQILTTLLPAPMEAKLAINRPVAAKSKMTKQEFSELTLDCMKYVTYLQKQPLEVEIPIMHENGSIGVQDFGFEDTFMLTLEVLMYNMMGFFTPENMGYLTGMMQNLAQTFATMKGQDQQNQV